MKSVIIYLSYFRAIQYVVISMAWKVGEGMYYEVHPLKISMKMANKIAIKIYYDELTGEIEKIDCTKRFAAEGRLFRMDVLKDAMESLDAIYEFEKSNFLDELTNSENKIIAKA